MIYGAIIGDIIGSRFEFNNYRSKHFKLITKDCHYTDDSIMTVAVYDALMNNRDVVDSMKYYYRKFPYYGYGGSFLRWLNEPISLPYDSCGNGAAMRVSSVGWLAESEEEVKLLSYEVTKVSHNHPEGLKGAEVTAMCIYLARTGHNKRDIYNYIVEQYPEIRNFKYNDLRKYYRFTELCQDTVPQAVYCFLISKNFIDCARTTVSIGGDSDTLCAISCAIAEAYYGFPKKLLKYIPKEFDEHAILQR